MNLSAKTILLGNSRDYGRLVLIICLLTTGAIWQSGLYGLIKTVFLLVLWLHYAWVKQSPKPVLALSGLILKEKSLLWIDTNNGLIEFDTANRLIDLGFFQLIQLVKEGKRRRVIPIFSDQASLEAMQDFRRWLSK